mmetsp:Transcript_174040/g.552522  ORF Transcript_174040/g.552522 Transcript_174040/m.552522 type:complete len:234 (-) Transcript_174040:147-848(-)
MCGFAVCGFAVGGFAVCGFAVCGVAVDMVVALLAVVDVVGRLAVVALLDRIGLVGIVALAAALVCKRIRTRVLGWGLDTGEVLLVVLLDGLQGVALEALRHPLVDLLLLGLTPRLELTLGLAVRRAPGRGRRVLRLGLARNACEVFAVLLGLTPRLELTLGLAVRRAPGRGRRVLRLGLARNACEVFAVLLLDGGLREVLVGLRRVLVHAPEGLLAPRLQLLRGVAICGGCWR